MTIQRWTPQNLRALASVIESTPDMTDVELDTTVALRTLADVIEAADDVPEVGTEWDDGFRSALAMIARIARGEQ